MQFDARSIAKLQARALSTLKNYPITVKFAIVQANIGRYDKELQVLNVWSGLHSDGLILKDD